MTEFVTNVRRQILSTLDVRVYQDLDDKTRVEFIQILNNFWQAVSEVFKVDWANKSRDMKRSYITHGTSIIGLSYLCRHMLRVFQTETRKIRNNSNPSERLPSPDFFVNELLLVKDHCHFNNGYWTLGLARNPDVKDLPYSRRWNDFQNTTSEKQLFATNILRLYEIQKGWRKDYPIYID